MEAHTNPKTILVPVDYSETSKQALQQAASLALTFKAKLVLLFAWAAPYADLPLSSEHLTTEQKSIFDLVRRESEDTMIGFIREVQAGFPDVEMQWFILSGDPRKVIVEQAEAQNADLVVMGSHGRTGAARIILGSVAEAVLRHASCPVMVVPSDAKAA
jgi:nucleotide-binding universal stress UspA family protein